MNYRILLCSTLALLIVILTPLISAAIPTTIQLATADISSSYWRANFPHFLQPSLTSTLFAKSSAAEPQDVLRQTTTNSTDSDPTLISRDEVNVVAREMWCPLCSGVRLDVCELTACDQMREEIAIKLAEGADGEEIQAYFLAQYGPQILGEPPRSGFNLLAWIVPFLALLVGGLYIFTSRRTQLQAAGVTTLAGANRDLQDTTDSQISTGLVTDGLVTDGTQENVLDGAANYEQLLDKELEQYE